MIESAKLNKFFPALSLVLLSQFAVTDAGANQGIWDKAKNNGAIITSCQTCHTTTPALKPNILAAYKLGYSQLKNLINGCPSGQTLNMTTFICATTAVQPKTVSGSVGSTANGNPATDIYAVTCPAGTTSLSASVKDNAPVNTALVSIQVSKPSTFTSSPLSTDAADGDAKYSPAAVLAGGIGPYIVQVNKQLSSAIGTELYTAQFACLNSAKAVLATPAPASKQQQ